MKISTDGQYVELRDFPFSMENILAADVVIIQTKDELLAELMIRALRADPSPNIYLKPVYFSSSISKRLLMMSEGIWEEQWDDVRIINQRIIQLLQSSIEIEDELLRRMFELTYTRNQIMQPFKNIENPLIYDYPIWNGLKVEEEEDIFRAIRKGAIWNIFQTKPLFNIHLCRECHSPHVKFVVDKSLDEIDQMFQKAACADCGCRNTLLDVIELPIETVVINQSFIKDISSDIKQSEQFSKATNNELFRQLLRTERQRTSEVEVGNSFLCTIDIGSTILQEYIKENQKDYEAYLKVTLRKFIEIDEQILFTKDKIFVLLLDIRPHEISWMRKRLFMTLQNDLKTNFDEQANIILDISAVRQRS